MIERTDVLCNNNKDLCDALELRGRVAAVKEYIKTTKYPESSLILAMLGEREEGGKENGITVRY